MININTVIRVDILIACWWGSSPLRVPQMRRYISRSCSIDTERGWGEGDSHVRLAVAVRGVTRGDSPNWFSNPVPFTIPLDILSVWEAKDEESGV